MVQWPGDPLLEMRLLGSLANGDEANVTALSLCAHTGTHIDAPLHYFADGADVASIPLDVLIGRAHVVDISAPWPAAERMLLRTSNSSARWWEKPFQPEFVSINPGQARRLVEGGVRLVGIDYLSIGNNTPEGAETHRILLSAGIVIVEGLDLTAVTPGAYELVCLPLKLVGADGAPARAALSKPLPSPAR
ncbi:MAG: cyclase family protein [Acidobacteria bacterium]|nr:cyclase family protein [Acidobacteriota bacterium]